MLLTCFLRSELKADPEGAKLRLSGFFGEME